MPLTVINRTLAPAVVDREPDQARGATSTAWREQASIYLPEPHPENWWVALSIVATVDPGVEGEVRFVLSHGGEISEPARIVRHVGPILLGWVQITGWPASGDQYASLQARRTVGQAGGVTILEVAPSLMTLPYWELRVGPNYPPGYDPGEEAPYPSHFDIADPYGG